MKFMAYLACFAFIFDGVTRHVHSKSIPAKRHDKRDDDDESKGIDDMFFVSEEKVGKDENKNKKPTVTKIKTQNLLERFKFNIDNHKNPELASEDISDANSDENVLFPGRIVTKADQEEKYKNLSSNRHQKNSKEFEYFDDEIFENEEPENEILHSEISKSPKAKSSSDSDEQTTALALREEGSVDTDSTKGSEGENELGDTETTEMAWGDLDYIDESDYFYNLETSLETEADKDAKEPNKTEENGDKTEFEKSEKSGGKNFLLASHRRQSNRKTESESDVDDYFKKSDELLNDERNKIYLDNSNELLSKVLELDNKNVDENSAKSLKNKNNNLPHKLRHKSFKPLNTNKKKNNRNFSGEINEADPEENYLIPGLKKNPKSKNGQSRRTSHPPNFEQHHAKLHWKIESIDNDTHENIDNSSFDINGHSIHNFSDYRVKQKGEIHLSTDISVHKTTEEDGNITGLEYASFEDSLNDYYNDISFEKNYGLSDSKGKEDVEDQLLFRHSEYVTDASVNKTTIDENELEYYEDGFLDENELEVSKNGQTDDVLNNNKNGDEIIHKNETLNRGGDKKKPESVESDSEIEDIPALDPKPNVSNKDGNLEKNVEDSHIHIGFTNGLDYYEDTELDGDHRSKSGDERSNEVMDNSIFSGSDHLNYTNKYKVKEKEVKGSSGKKENKHLNEKKFKAKKMDLSKNSENGEDYGEDGSYDLTDLTKDVQGSSFEEKKKDKSPKKIESINLENYYLDSGESFGIQWDKNVNELGISESENEDKNQSKKDELTENDDELQSGEDGSHKNVDENHSEEIGSSENDDADQLEGNESSVNDNKSSDRDEMSEEDETSEKNEKFDSEKVKSYKNGNKKHHDKMDSSKNSDRNQSKINESSVNHDKNQSDERPTNEIGISQDNYVDLNRKQDENSNKSDISGWKSSKNSGDSHEDTYNDFENEIPIDYEGNDEEGKLDHKFDDDSKSYTDFPENNTEKSVYEYDSSEYDDENDPWVYDDASYNEEVKNLVKDNGDTNPKGHSGEKYESAYLRDSNETKRGGHVPDSDEKPRLFYNRGNNSETDSRQGDHNIGSFILSEDNTEEDDQTTSNVNEYYDPQNGVSYDTYESYYNGENRNEEGEERTSKITEEKEVEIDNFLFNRNPPENKEKRVGSDEVYDQGPSYEYDEDDYEDISNHSLKEKHNHKVGESKEKTKETEWRVDKAHNEVNADDDYEYYDDDDRKTQSKTDKMFLVEYNGDDDSAYGNKINDKDAKKFHSPGNASETENHGYIRYDDNSHDEEIYKDETGSNNKKGDSIIYADDYYEGKNDDNLENRAEVNYKRNNINIDFLGSDYNKDNYYEYEYVADTSKKEMEKSDKKEENYVYYDGNSRENDISSNDEDRKEQEVNRKGKEYRKGDSSHDDFDYDDKGDDNSVKDISQYYIDSREDNGNSDDEGESNKDEGVNKISQYYVDISEDSNKTEKSVDNKVGVKISDSEYMVYDSNAYDNSSYEEINVGGSPDKEPTIPIWVECEEKEDLSVQANDPEKNKAHCHQVTTQKESTNIDDFYYEEPIDVSDEEVALYKPDYQESENAKSEYRDENYGYGEPHYYDQVDGESDYRNFFEGKNESVIEGHPELALRAEAEEPTQAPDEEDEKEASEEEEGEYSEGEDGEDKDETPPDEGTTKLYYVKVNCKNCKIRSKILVHKS